METTAPRTAHPVASTPEREPVLSRIVCAGAAAAAIAPVVLVGFPGDSGAEITAGIVEDAVALQVAAFIAVLASAGLFLASVRLGDVLGGMAGRVATAAGAAVAVLFAAYYSTFGAAGTVATVLLDEPGPGLGEAASLLLNVVEITRYGPGLALVVAAVVSRRMLAKAIWIPAAVLAVMSLAPFTAWIAAVLIPMWLGLAAAFPGDGRPRRTRD